MRQHLGFQFLKLEPRKIPTSLNFQIEWTVEYQDEVAPKHPVSAIWLFGLAYLASTQKIWHRIGRKSRKVITNRPLGQVCRRGKAAGHEGQEEAALREQQGQDLRLVHRWWRRLHHQEEQEGDRQRDIDLRGSLQ